MPGPGLGEFMATPTSGFVGWAIRKIIHSPVNHAAIYIGKGFVVEAQPGGARIVKADRYPKAFWSHQTLTIHTRLVLIDTALGLVGTPYSFLDIAALAIEHLFKRHTPTWIKQRIQRSDRLICSQLVDEAYRRAGIQLFPGRASSDVTPGDLYNLIIAEKHG